MSSAGQNRSHAVMAQRAEPHDSLDDFPTQPWAGRALVEHVIHPTSLLMPKMLRSQVLWEPAANRGFLYRALAPYFAQAVGTDIFDYGAGFLLDDFLYPHPGRPRLADWIITNPPFRLAEAFVARAAEAATTGYAMLVRTGFLEGIGRYNRLYAAQPPTIVAHFAERVPMVKGRCDPDATTATAYCWLVWIKGADRQPPLWIPPCRAKLERPGDYDLPTSILRRSP